MREKIMALALALAMMTGCSVKTAVSSDKDYSSETENGTSSSASVSSVTESSAPETEMNSSDSKAESNDVTNDNGGKEMKVHFLDVGQGDSIFIELPDDKTMLIDASEKEYADRITTYIYSCGYSSLDYVVATHPHSDHIGGMADVIGSFIVGNVILSPATHTTKTYTNMLTAIDQSGAKVTLGIAGKEIFSDGDLSAVAIAPVTEDYSDLNNSSVMVMLTYGDKKFLFTGDAEEEEERTVTADVKCDVLKVGHHGSSTSTSSAFLAAASPEYAVISCGMGNSYGHPHTETIDKLKKAGINIYRTDLQGDIIMTCDGEKITVNAEPSAAGGASSGESKSETTKASTTTKVTATTVTEKPAEENPVSYSYVLNTNTMKIHRAGCSSVSQMSEENKGYTNDYDGAIAQGYEPCKRCKP
ncbi:MAG: MBL fold metallo-hydrolase [Ruminiclostridium sp.]|nr:MBL fold metallo-hydrolase [Ruminiclostridium sp.]